MPALLWASLKDRDWDEHAIYTRHTCGYSMSTSEVSTSARFQVQKNCADLFTKPLTRESAEHLSELIGMEFPEGHDEIAFTINFIGQSRRHISSSIQSSLQNLGLRGTYFIWTRMDLKSKCFRTSAKGGPSWKDVEARLTLDASTGHVIEIEAARDITRECEHRLLPGGPCDIVTLLIWSNPTIVSGLRLRI